MPRNIWCKIDLPLGSLSRHFHCPQLSVGCLCPGWHWAKLTHRGGSVAWGRWHRGAIPAQKESTGASARKAKAKTQVSDTTQAPLLGTCNQTAALISQVQKAVRITALLPANRQQACLTAAGPDVRGSTRGQNLRTGFYSGCWHAGSMYTPAPHSGEAVCQAVARSTWGNGWALPQRVSVVLGSLTHK